MTSTLNSRSEHFFNNSHCAHRATGLRPSRSSSKETSRFSTRLVNGRPAKQYDSGAAFVQESPSVTRKDTAPFPTSYPSYLPREALRKLFNDPKALENLLSLCCEQLSPYLEKSAQQAVREAISKRLGSSEVLGHKVEKKGANTTSDSWKRPLLIVSRRCTKTLGILGFQRHASTKDCNQVSYCKRAGPSPSDHCSRFTQTGQEKVHSLSLGQAETTENIMKRSTLEIDGNPRYCKSLKTQFPPQYTSQQRFRMSWPQELENKQQFELSSDGQIVTELPDRSTVLYGTQTDVVHDQALHNSEIRSFAGEEVSTFIQDFSPQSSSFDPVTHFLHIFSPISPQSNPRSSQSQPFSPVSSQFEPRSSQSHVFSPVLLQSDSVNFERTSLEDPFFLHQEVSPGQDILYNGFGELPNTPDMVSFGLGAVLENPVSNHHESFEPVSHPSLVPPPLFTTNNGVPGDNRRGVSPSIAERRPNAPSMTVNTACIPSSEVLRPFHTASTASFLVQTPSSVCTTPQTIVTPATTISPVSPNVSPPDSCSPNRSLSRRRASSSMVHKKVAETDEYIECSCGTRIKGKPKTSKSNFQRHLDSFTKGPIYRCSTCGGMASRSDNLKSHGKVCKKGANARRKSLQEPPMPTPISFTQIGRHASSPSTFANRPCLVSSNSAVPSIAVAPGSPP